MSVWNAMGSSHRIPSIVATFFTRKMFVGVVGMDQGWKSDKFLKLKFQQEVKSFQINLLYPPDMLMPSITSDCFFSPDFNQLH